MNILVTGAAGFVGYQLTEKLKSENYKIICIDNINDYYDIELKYDRLKNLGFYREDIRDNLKNLSCKYNNIMFYKTDIKNFDSLNKIIQDENIDLICHLAAQAGVRYSLINPRSYIENNITGYFNVLEVCRENNIKKLVYASSSSVYGGNEKQPFSEEDIVDHPESLYAATKKSNELMAYTYSKLYNIQTVGLRFFTVYGPWGRPDMAYYSFLKNIIEGIPIKVFNNGNMKRDFTYIDDIINGICSIIKNKSKCSELSAVYNIGRGNPVDLMEFIRIIEKLIGIKAVKKMMPIQKGDVPETYADIDKLKKDYNYEPCIDLEYGLKEFVSWYKEYYNADVKS